MRGATWPDTLCKGLIFCAAIGFGACKSSSSAGGAGLNFDPLGFFTPREITPHKIQKAMGSFQAAHPEAPATVFAVYSERRGLRFEGATGVFDVKSKANAQGDDAFPLGEVEHAFVAVTALALEEDGVLSLSDDVDTGEGSKARLETLLHAGGGAAQWGRAPRRAAEDQRRTAHEAYAHVRRHLEKKVGKPFTSIVRERVLDPLGLLRTWTLGAERQPANVRLLATPTVPEPHGLAGTAGDLARFEIQLRAGKPFRSPATRDRLYRWLVVDDSYAYGNGFERRVSDSGRTLVGHASTTGVGAFVFRLQDDDLVVAGASPVVVASREERLWPLLLARVEDLVAREHEGIPPSRPQQPAPTAPPKARPTAQPSHP